MATRAFVGLDSTLVLDGIFIESSATLRAIVKAVTHMRAKS